jgi:hypothetical protein
MKTSFAAQGRKESAWSGRRLQKELELLARRADRGCGEGQSDDRRDFVASVSERVPESEADTRKVTAKIVESVARRRKHREQGGPGSVRR